MKIARLWVMPRQLAACKLSRYTQKPNDHLRNEYDFETLGTNCACFKL